VNSNWWIPVAAYLLGSIPFGLLIVKVTGGGDIREVGSGNIGAANVARSAGAVAGSLTLLLDGGKGYLAVWLAGRYAHANARWMMAAALAAVVGHVFSVWLKFKGGKGVATTFGVFLPICLYAVIAAAASWLLIVLLWRFSSLGSIFAISTLPVWLYFFYAPHHAPPDYMLATTILISLLVLWKHRENMRRLIAGDENRLGPPK
jgi:acyl phosphate:glycerol-3-phosphate acyltransferase